ncbi:hypothetical protein RJC76_12010 [Acinetobacter nosocomialis]|uniref:hypothetical protein n=1 Tax=Acinetobacter nosocomialis TaxID=106654 RepID=UPI000B3DC317|nr:hypothetical protein [Acinetobacter nosocomialis]MDR9533147.1 hypothetical protein [Acinetobacter nosocomialis]OUT27928.1 hypothetical protein H125_03669 [Acinetobacter nosocomialis P020]PSE17345.1 hypothetical protein C7G95_03700 [Acinetobacter nosocomialis]WFD61237.1 recombination protein [Acinetobacter phage XC1]
MKPEQFIRKHGVKRTKECIPAYEKHYCGLEKLFVDDLKRLVESLDLVKDYGGIINAKMDVRYLDIDWDYDSPRRVKLDQAIKDHESIYGGGDE